MTNNYLFFTGFENGSSEHVYSAGVTYSIQSTKQKSGTYALRCNPTTTNNGTWCILALGSTGYMPSTATSSTTYVKFDFLYDTKPASGSEEIYVARAYGGSQKISIRIDSSGNLSIYNSSNTLVSTGTTVLSSNTWYCIELKMVAGASGAFELRIDTGTELSGTCAQNFNADTHCWGKYNNNNSQTVDFYFDNVVAAYDTWVGPSEVVTLRPNANGSTAQWTSGTGSSNYLEVDEVVADGTTTYIASNGSANQTHLVLFSSQDYSGKNIKCVKTQNYSYTPSGTSATTHRVISNGTTSDLLQGAIGAGLNFNTRYIDQDPNTGAAWTAAAVNAIEVGVVEGNAVATRCSQISYSALITTVQTRDTSAISMRGVG